MSKVYMYVCTRTRVHMHTHNIITIFIPRIICFQIYIVFYVSLNINNNE